MRSHHIGGTWGYLETESQPSSFDGLSDSGPLVSNVPQSLRVFLWDAEVHDMQPLVSLQKYKPELHVLWAVVPRVPDREQPSLPTASHLHAALGKGPLSKQTFIS